MNKRNHKIPAILCYTGIFVFSIFNNILSSEEKKANAISFKINLNEKDCQMAVWITDAKGTFIDTVYVSKKTGQEGMGNRPGGIDDRTGGARLSALPVWAYSRGINYGGGNYYPPQDKPLSDAVSSASPKSGEFSRTWRPNKPLKPGKYFYYIEVSKSFDKNKSHNYSWYRGQPSVVWKGTIMIGDKSSNGKAAIIGHGHPAGADGKINPDTSTLTTALKYIDSAEATYRP